MNQQKALEILRSFLVSAQSEDEMGKMEIRRAQNALNYLENWCLIESNDQ